jgi:hypothetical protein
MMSDSLSSISGLPASRMSHVNLSGDNERLLKGVAAKLFVDLIVVCVIVSLTAFSQSSPLVRGRVDVANGQRVAGWVYDPRSPDQGIEVQLFVDGRFAQTKVANEYRPDLTRLGRAGPNHGFSFDLSLPSGPHRMEVFVVRPGIAGSKVLRPYCNSPSLAAYMLDENPSR